MATAKQKLGRWGEEQIARSCSCPRCKRRRTLKRLPDNFKCADVICDFCGYLAQVKAVRTRMLDRVPRSLPGAAWGVQIARMQAGIYFSLFIVLGEGGAKRAIYYLPADLQYPAMFVARQPLSPSARRAGWQGFRYDMSQIAPGSLIRLE
ncbi:MAG: hypothetical protein HY678_01090 [Chloroflexi bacterium]|nr:hypothetical protein [Chloroflexota bacterium]